MKGLFTFKLCSLAVLLCFCGQPSSETSTPRSDDSVVKGGYGGTSTDERYRMILAALKLTDDPASPSDLVSDESYRNKLKDEMIKDIDSIACQSISVLSGEEVDSKNQVVTYLVQYRLAKYTQDFQALITVPQKSGSYPLMIYGTSGFEVPYQGAELKALVGSELSRVVTATPMLSDEPFIFNGKNHQPALSGAAYLGDVDRMYGLSLCLQNNHASLSFGSRTLSSVLKLSKNDFPGMLTIGSGSGRGGLIASLAMARSGAALLGSVTEPTRWARYDCAVLANPLHSFYGAEARLALAALVRGNTEETRYTKIPGLRQLRYEIFHNYREGTLTAEDVAFQLAKRDAFITAPFVNLALKDYTADADDKGGRAGGLLLMHGSSRTDFAINNSRIYANVASSVNFYSTESTNGMNILYREFEEARYDERESYKSIFSKNFLQNPGKLIADFNIFFADDLKGKEKQYRWVIRGSAYPGLVGKTPGETLSGFLGASCGLSQ